jgi:hypothetical protein
MMDQGRAALLEIRQRWWRGKASYKDFDPRENFNLAGMEYVAPEKLRKGEGHYQQLDAEDEAKIERIVKPFLSDIDSWNYKPWKAKGIHMLEFETTKKTMANDDIMDLLDAGHDAAKALGKAGYVGQGSFSGDEEATEDEASVSLYFFITGKRRSAHKESVENQTLREMRVMAGVDPLPSRRTEGKATAWGPPDLNPLIAPLPNERSARNKANKALADLSRKYHQGIPTTELTNILDQAGFDSRPLEGIYTGRDGKSHDQVGPKTWLALSWHKMDSGNYEINAYLS